MKAEESILLKILESTKQYVVPLFQRTYCWDKKHWDTLWKDIVELYEMENPRTHFFGSIVTLPSISVPHGVAKYSLIDGQQRLTTIFVLLILLRNTARKQQCGNLPDKINNNLLVNQYEDGDDYYKLMPTQIDRVSYRKLIHNEIENEENQITRAYIHFEKKLRQREFDLEKLKTVITTNLSMVSIVLAADDNPHLVFESLNYKSERLTQADLIRNYFFMQIHIKEQDDLYNNYWLQMQKTLKKDMTEFIRHFLIMEDGNFLKNEYVYYVFKERVTIDNALQYLIKLEKYSRYYQKMKYPDYETQPELKKMFYRLNRMEVTTTYPFLLNIYSDYDQEKISIDDFVTILRLLENYLIRRYVCGIHTTGLNKIFPTLYTLIQQKHSGIFTERLKNILQNKQYPKDDEFFTRFKDFTFYGDGNKRIKTKLILEIIESNYNHKEEVLFQDLTIEHIMPQTLSEWWTTNLGEDWEVTHELYLHTIGNLTLTAYNSELSGSDFSTKKKILSESHLELNKYFANTATWTKTDIEERAEILGKKALEIWSYFGLEKKSEVNDHDVTNTKPVGLKIIGQKFRVNSWSDVMENTLNVIADLEPEKFEKISLLFPKFVAKDKQNFRRARALKNNYYIEVNRSAQNIKQFCYRAIDEIELTSEDWEVEILSNNHS